MCLDVEGQKRSLRKHCTKFIKNVYILLIESIFEDVLKGILKVFSKKSSIKEDFVEDDEGNKFLCMEAGSVRHCTMITENDNKKET